MPPPILARSPFRFSPVSGRAHWGRVHERPNRVSTNFRVPSASSARSADKRVCSAVYLEAGVTISTIAHSIRHPRQQRQVLDTRWPIATLFQRTEEHTSELQSLMRISYAVSCLKKKT